MKRDCHQVAMEIEKLCRRFEIKLETFWISRELREIEFCDAWSKEVDESDYWMSKSCFKELQRKFGLSAWIILRQIIHIRLGRST